MDMYKEQKYEHTINQIMVQFENLIMDIILTSIKRLNENMIKCSLKLQTKNRWMI